MIKLRASDNEAPPLNATPPSANNVRESIPLALICGGVRTATPLLLTCDGLSCGAT